MSASIPPAQVQQGASSPEAPNTGAYLRIAFFAKTAGANEEKKIGYRIVHLSSELSPKIAFLHVIDIVGRWFKDQSFRKDLMDALKVLTAKS